MTSARSLATSLLTFSLVSLAGCAVIPISGDDNICLNCATPDASDVALLGTDSGPLDAGTMVPSGTRGSLCIGSCNPKYSSDTPDNPNACTVDGGTYLDGSTNGADLACRVILPPNSNEAVKCVQAGSHGDGASCNSGADCAPGYECVGAPTGMCRHYCCSETYCANMTNSSTTNKYFCDVQPETASPSVLVPVCMVAQPCNLLQNGCGDGMTCTLVDPLNSDLTSCVAIGTAQVGESCEIEHCAADMICVGPYGQRTCRQLCNSTHLCSYPQQCDGQWSQLAKFNVGICQ